MHKECSCIPLPRLEDMFCAIGLKGMMRGSRELLSKDAEYPQHQDKGDYWPGGSWGYPQSCQLCSLPVRGSDKPWLIPCLQTSRHPHPPTPAFPLQPQRSKSISDFREHKCPQEQRKCFQPARDCDNIMVGLKLES